MAVEIIYDSKRGRAVMCCNTTGWAFGPVFHDEDPPVPSDCEMLDAHDLCELFQLWLIPDPRDADNESTLEEDYRTFLNARGDGMYPKLSGKGCGLCGGYIGHHEKCSDHE